VERNQKVPHILDNPIWNALQTGSSKLAEGDDLAKFLHRDVGLFAGLKENSIEDLMHLQEQTPLKTPAVLFVPAEITVPNVWSVLVTKPLLQMVYLHQAPPEPLGEVVALSEKDVDAMLTLTAITEPGPFLSRTIDFGNYEGIFEAGELIAMAGQRLQPDPYVEISAVCTHPDHVGKGYAAMLVRNQIRSILERSRVPFLHVLPENTAACRLYLKLGFEIRREMLCYVLER
jgi:predicted GNAT family acetyltransferase